MGRRIRVIRYQCSSPCWSSIRRCAISRRPWVLTWPDLTSQPLGIGRGSPLQNEAGDDSVDQFFGSATGLRRPSRIWAHVKTTAAKMPVLMIVHSGFGRVLNITTNTASTPRPAPVFSARVRFATCWLFTLER